MAIRTRPAAWATRQFLWKLRVGPLLRREVVRAFEPQLFPYIGNCIAKVR